jgi:hypothetical protein
MTDGRLLRERFVVPKRLCSRIGVQQHGRERTGERGSKRRAYLKSVMQRTQNLFGRLEDGNGRCRKVGHSLLERREVELDLGPKSKDDL